MRGILIEIPDVLHKAFRVKLLNEGLTIKKVMTEFIEEYVKDGDKGTKNSSKIEE